MSANLSAEKSRHVRFEKVRTALTLHPQNWTAKKVITKVLWAIIFIVGAVLTVVMSFKIIHQFHEDPTITKLTLRTNKTINLPTSPSLCLSTQSIYASELWYMQLYDTDIYDDEEGKYYLSDFIDEEQVSRDYFVGEPVSGINQWPRFITKTVDLYRIYIAKDEFGDSYGMEMDKIFDLNVTMDELFERLDKELVLLMNNVSATPYQDAVHALFDQNNMTKENILLHDESSNSWKPSAIFLALRCLRMATRVENGMSALEEYDEDEHKINVDDILISCLALETGLQNLGITTDDFRQKFGREILRLFEVDFSSVGELARITTVSSMEVCYKIKMHPIHKGFQRVESPNVSLSDYDYKKFPPSLTPLYPNSTFAVMDFSGKERDILTDFDDADSGSHVLVLHMDQRQLIRQTSESYFIRAGFGENQIITMSISAIYRYLPEVKGEKHCSQENIIYNCFRNCKVTLIENLFNCTPSSLIPLNEGSHDKECKIEDLSQWFYDDDYMTEEKTCDRNCLNSCDDYQLKLDVRTSKWPRRQIKLTFLFTGFEHAFYEETYALTLENFAGNLGGVLGLWLGIDLIVAVQYIVASITFIYGVLTHLRRPHIGVYNEAAEKSAVASSFASSDRQSPSNGEQQITRELETMRREIRMNSDENEAMRKEIERIHQLLEGKAI